MDDTAGTAVRDVYDRIARHFSSTREHPWPEVQRFVAEVAPGDVDLALDVGCGNGRHAAVLSRVATRVVGVDVSRGLLSEARARASDRGYALDLLQGDAAALPIATSCVDLAVYVATIHHLPTRGRRRASLDELARVLAPGGRALVSAWSTAHDRFEAREGFDTMIDWTLPGGERVPRFYHIYDPAEFEADLDASALVVFESFVSSGNCYAVVGVE